MQTTLTTVRLSAQQLTAPSFQAPSALVRWMGAMQAQDYNMVKWAIGIRLQNSTLQSVETAIDRGEILRTHLLRPTWHFVAAEDIRWMLKLTGPRIRSAFDSYARARKLEITEALYTQCLRSFEGILEGHKSLTKQEMGHELEKTGIPVDNHRVAAFLSRGETEGVLCSGRTKNGKSTYALLEERAPVAKEWTREEALAKLALAYFRSHSPATLADFVWWSGLSLTEARQGISLISGELHTEKTGTRELFIHQQWTSPLPASTVHAHLLPAFDEYLISYKDRTDLLHPTHFPHAFNNWGTFYPVILHRGKVVGNWKRATSKKECTLAHSLFEAQTECHEKLLEKATDHYKRFMLCP